MTYFSGATPAPGYTLIETPEMAVEWFRRYAEREMRYKPDWLEPLRGKDLICFCPLSAPCHADTLLSLANVEPGAEE
jgi:hypothetical protein